VPGVLKGSHALQRDPVAECDVGCGDVDAELHSQRASERQLAFELTLWEHVDGVPGQLGEAHLASLDRRPG
jgi:hypothetical protein